MYQEYPIAIAIYPQATSMRLRNYMTSKIQMPRPTAPTRSTIMLASYPIAISGKAQAWFAPWPLAPVSHTGYWG